ncbi:MAG: sensor histidine kinase [Oscillospiraceae bacterium]|nr:sensor histidine kinase [Oscillospiraceae bacterium]
MPGLKSRLFAAGVFFCLLSFSVVAMLYRLNVAVPRISVHAPGGLADLTGFDFVSSVAHVGDAEFYPGRLLFPDELEGLAPGGFDETARYYTARVRFAVPDGDYMIFGLSPNYASVLYINGRLAETFGRIDEDDESHNFYRVAPFSAAARPIDGVIELVAQVAGIVRDDAYYTGFTIGSHGTASYRILCDTVYRMIPVVIAGMCALFYFGYFIFMPSVRSNLWFSLISLVTGFFLSGGGGFTYPFFPALDYPFEFVAATLTLLTICVLYSLFTRSMYGIPKMVPAIVGAVSAVFAALIVSLPVRIAARYLTVHIVFVFTVMAICSVCVLRGIRRFKPEHAISFCGQMIFMAFGVLDMLGASAAISFFELTTVGILIFIFAQMLALYLVNNRAAENERRLAEENTALEQRNRLKGEFLQNVSHELKTPLTVMSNYSQLTRRRAETAEVPDEYTVQKMKLVESEAERMALMVSQLMEFAHEAAPELNCRLARIALPPLIRGMTDAYFPVLNKNHNKVVLALPDALPDVWADGERITQVLVNLTDNAVRFTKNGTVTLGARPSRQGVELYVKDTGRGMDEEERARAKERFYSGGGEANSGTGLGLHICGEIIKAHGSEIHIESARGKGTRVSFELKAALEKGAADETDHSAD